ncbi:MAG TPA: hypothetical protein VNA25_15755 [Phycisphaerae bacterium]|nr:hypothetical protein [Phycisphaerae bacterium]
MNDQPVIRDERTFAVADKSFRFAYMVLAFGVLITGAVRGLAFQEACWDLLGLVFVSSVVATVYQRAKHVQVLPRNRALLSVLIAMAVALAGGIAFVLLKR